MGGFLSRFLGGPGGEESSDDAAAAAAAASSSVIAFHSAARWQLHFNSSRESSKLTVIDFWATWCGPCRFMEPIYNDMAARFSDVDFVKIDVDELSDVAQEFGVQAMPTFVLTKKGKEVDRVVGAKKDELERKVQKHRS